MQVDPFDRAQFDAWHATYAAAEAFGRGDHATDWLLEESRAAKQADDPYRTLIAFAGLVGDEIVACSEFEVWVNDSPHLARGKVWTHPGHRRHGHGTRMAAHLEQQVLLVGATTLVCDVAIPHEAPADGFGHPDAEFARRRGYDLAIGAVQRVLRLPVDSARLDELDALIAPHHTAYTFRSFRGRVPDDLVEGYVDLWASLDTEAPMGDLALEPAVPDIDAFRIDETTVTAQRRTRWATEALAADGTVAGYTDLVTSALEPDRAFQWGTLVRADHRGARLGLALKVRNTRQLQEHGPAVRRIHTWNADVNVHMIAVNEQLGFEPVERLGEFQKVLVGETS